MSDVTIKPVESGFSFSDRAAKIVPYYLVVVEDIDTKGKSFTRHFIATKFDEGTSFAKFVGFYSDATIEKINQDFKEIINTADKKLYVEVLVPWRRVISIQNLIFRQK